MFFWAAWGVKLSGLAATGRQEIKFTVSDFSLTVGRDSVMVTVRLVDVHAS